MGTGEQQARSDVTTPAQRQSSWIYAIAGVLFLIVFTHLPIAYFSEAGHDDAWFLGKAISIASGHWFGHYDQYALMKGPGYPLFLVLVSATGLPIALAEGALFAFGLAVLCRSLARLTGAFRSCAVLYAATLWHPVFLVPRLIRDAIYPAQVFFVLAFAIEALLFANSLRRTVICSLLFGLAAAWYWLTREEGAWLMPGLAVLSVAALAISWRDALRFRRTLIALVVMALSSGGLVASYGLINKAVYGDYVLVDFKERGFIDALDALQSVQVGDATTYLPVPKRVRAEVYKVSPHFAELRNYFDGPQPSPWSVQGCGAYPQTCGDIAGGWFVWALRDAAAAAGKYSSPAVASSFYGAIASEVRAACSTGALVCKNPVLRGLPVMNSAEVASILPQIVRGLGMVLLVDKAGAALSLHGVTPGSSVGEPFKISIARIFLNAENIAPAQSAPVDYMASGWYMDRDHGWFKLIARSADNGLDEITVPRRDSPDLVAAFSDAAANRQRFRVRIPCDDACVLTIRSDSSATASVRLADMHPATSLSVGAGELYLDYLQSSDGHRPLLDTRPVFANAARLAAAKPYGYVAPAIISAAFLAFCAACILAWLRRSQGVGLLPLSVAFALWMLVGARIVLLALVHVTLFPAVDPLYMMPAFYLTVIASGISLICFAHACRPTTSSSGAPV